MASSLGTFLRSLTIAGAVAAALYFAFGPNAMLEGFLPGEAAAQSDEHPAVTYRQSLMQTNKWHIGKLAAMAKGEAPFDAEAARHHANVIAVLATAIPEGFPEGSDTEESDALPAVWENFSEFESYANDLNAAAMALAEAGDVSQDNLGGYVQEIGGACGHCHDDFRPED